MLVFADQPLRSQAAVPFFTYSFVASAPKNVKHSEVYLARWDYKRTKIKREGESRSIRNIQARISFTLQHPLDLQVHQRTWIGRYLLSNAYPTSSRLKMTSPDSERSLDVDPPRI